VIAGYSVSNLSSDIIWVNDVLMMSTGFSSLFALAGPRTRGWMILVIIEPPSGVKPVTHNNQSEYGLGREFVRTAEFDLLNEVQGGSFGVDVVSFDSAVQESDLDTVLIEQCSTLSDSRKDAKGVYRSACSPDDVIY
jgi:hypothetical protein